MSTTDRTPGSWIHKEDWGWRKGYAQTERHRKHWLSLLTYWLAKYPPKRVNFESLNFSEYPISNQILYCKTSRLVVWFWRRAYSIFIQFKHVCLFKLEINYNTIQCIQLFRYYAGETRLVVLGFFAFGHLYSKRKPKHPPIVNRKTTSKNTFFHVVRSGVIATISLLLDHSWRVLKAYCLRLGLFKK